MSDNSGMPVKLRRRRRSAGQQGGKRDSDTVRGAADRQFASEEITAYERARKAGVIGAVQGTAPDLSTNPKYLDGFGVSEDDG